MVTWQTVEIVPFRRSGRWILGALVQEDDSGKRRIKLFKGRIKEDGTHELVYKGERIKFSMVQRINIPSRRYWEFLKMHVDTVVRRYLTAEEKEGKGKEDEGTVTLFDFQ